MTKSPFWDFIQFNFTNKTYGARLHCDSLIFTILEENRIFTNRFKAQTS